jgi:hypothetical protein
VDNVESMLARIARLEYLLDHALVRPAGGGGGVSAVTATLPLTSTGGGAPNLAINAATDALAGSMSAADKTKLDGITPGAAVASVSGLAPIASSGGTMPVVSIAAATDVAAGSMSAADKTKLDGIVAGAAVSAVTGTAPIVSSGGDTPAISISPATDATPGSLSAADKTKLDAIPAGQSFWPYNVPIPGSVAAPVLEQAQDTTGTTPNITFQTAAAKTGSGNPGGNAYFVGGAGDGLTLPYPTSNQGFNYLLNTSVSGSSSYYLGRLFYNGAGVVGLQLGGGANGVGSGVAGVEISCYSELSLATEGGLVNCVAVAGPNQSNWYLKPCLTDATNEAGLAITIDFSHPTSGDVSCVQVLAVDVGSFGTGTLRYYDAELGGVRRFSFNEQGGFASLAFYDTSGNTANEQSFIALPFGPTTGSSDVGIMVQRNPTNTGDLEIISRQNATRELFFGSYSEINRLHTLNQTAFEALTTGALGFQFSNPNNVIGAFRSDTHATIVHGAPDGGHSGCIAQLYHALTASTAAAQQVALVPLQAGVNQIHWVLTAWDTTGTNFASFEIVTCYYANGTTTVTSPSAAATITDTGHTAGAGTSIAVTLVPGASGGVTNVAVNVTPWTGNSISWTLRAVTVVNPGNY